MMKKLKTLRDLIGCCKWYPNCNRECLEINPEELKAEAIKWAKESLEEELINMNAGRLIVAHYWKGRKNALVDFHNITEEDIV